MSSSNLLLILVIFLASCYVGSTDEHLKKVQATGLISHCTDTRDGEKFSFTSKDISSFQTGIGVDACFNVTDTKGKKRQLCKSHEAWIKCDTQPGPMK